jgi:hypothetical protein
VGPLGQREGERERGSWAALRELGLGGPCGGKEGKEMGGLGLGVGLGQGKV